MNPKIHLTLSLLIVIILTLLMILIKQKFKSNFYSSSNIECGFKSMAEKNFKFSNQFFMIAILFVIFDMELIVIMPIPITSINMKMYSIMIFIMIMLIFSIFMEWMNGLMEWIK